MRLTCQGARLGSLFPSSVAAAALPTSVPVVSFSRRPAARRQPAPFTGSRNPCHNSATVPSRPSTCSYSASNSFNSASTTTTTSTMAAPHVSAQNNPALHNDSQTEPTTGIAAQIASIRNIRDFHESYPDIKSGRVIRCARPADASVADVDRLLNTMCVRDLLDLRAMEEIQEDLPESHLFSQASRLISHKRGWWTGRGPLPVLPAEPEPHDTVLHHHVSLLEKSRWYPMLLTHVPWRKTLWAAAQRLWGDKEGCRQTLLKEVNDGGLPLLYRMLVDWSQPEILTALTLVTQSLEKKRTVMLFCKAGKDRTGLVSALVLHCAGASRQDILNDYVKSDKYHMMALAGIEKTEELKGIRHDVFARAPREAMEAILDYIDQRYGGLGLYLTHIGFDNTQQDKLKQLLTTDTQ